MLEARNVTFSYHGTGPVLDSVDVTLERGEIVILTGPTGSGKSTLSKFLCGYIPRAIGGECSGQLLIDGSDVAALSLAEISRRVALVQQDPESQLCTLKVSDEAAFGPENYLVEPGQISRLVESSLSSMGSSHLVDRPTYALSGGEKQRVVIASMLACQPDYLILDEPSSSLDPRGVLQLRQTLLDMKRNDLGVICIEHDLNAVRPVADRVLTLSKGKLFSLKPDVSFKSGGLSASSDGPAAYPRKGPIVQASDVSFAYEEKTVIRRVSVAVYSGETVALMGDNGSGKSTLIGLLGGLLNPLEGEVRLDSVPIRNVPRRDRAKRVGIVFQNPNTQIFEKTVWREYTLTRDVLRLTDSVDLEPQLRKAGLADLKNRNPFSLSHGQKRRLNLCSATVHNPELYLFDEPFTGQDEEGRDFILGIIGRRASTGGACVVATHDSSFAARYCSRLIFMENGSILLDGPPRSVLQRLRAIGRSEYSILEVAS
jgi:energy-coupling factor transport system ATP-binding protein